MARSHNIPRKSTDTDMTPFVDVAFLILSFFIMATKFKPPEPVEITTPNSVSSDVLPENDAALITISKDNKVYYSILSEKDPDLKVKVVEYLNTARNLGLTPAEISNFKKSEVVGVPFSQLKSFLDVPAAEQNKVKQSGIPVTDSTNNELKEWVGATKLAFAGRKLTYLIKGDNESKYPTFNGITMALKKNEEFKYDLVTSPEDVPGGTDLSIERLDAQRKKND